MVRQLGDEVDVGDPLIEDDAIDRLHVGADEVEQRLQPLRRAPGGIE